MIMAIKLGIDNMRKSKQHRWKQIRPQSKDSFWDPACGYRFLGKNKFVQTVHAALNALSEMERRWVLHDINSIFSPDVFPYLVVNKQEKARNTDENNTYIYG